MKSTPAARFIVLEGIDGSGKSSQIAPLADSLRAAGKRVVTCRDPGATAAGDAIRSILLHRQEITLSATAEMLLYMAARAQLVAEVIVPALNRGDWVISDRFLPANIVYQGYAGGLDPDSIRQVGEVATGGLEPDLVLLLDIDPAAALSRIERPLDKLENRGADHRSRLRDGYRQEAARRPDRWVIIDAVQSLPNVTGQIVHAVAGQFHVSIEAR